MDEDTIESWKKIIDDMTHIQMCELWRFAPLGHPIFDIKLPLYDYFKKKYDALGGMTPEISKLIGWR